MNIEEGRIRWQEEEVDWGSFIPYDTVVAAADLSIARLARCGTYQPTVLYLVPSK